MMCLQHWPSNSSHFLHNLMFGNNVGICYMTARYYGGYGEDLACVDLCIHLMIWRFFIWIRLCWLLPLCLLMSPVLSCTCFSACFFLYILHISKTISTLILIFVLGRFFAMAGASSFLQVLLVYECSQSNFGLITIELGYRCLKRSNLLKATLLTKNWATDDMDMD